MTQPEDVMVLQTLHIVDKIGNRRPQVAAPPPQHPTTLVEQVDARGVRVPTHEVFVPSSTSFDTTSLDADRCVDSNSLIAGAVVFIVAQVLLLVVWVLFWKKKRSQMAKEVVTTASQLSSADSLSYMYDTGFQRRLR